MSPTDANKLADHPWCAAVANPISAMTTHRFDVTEAKKTGVTQQAQISMTVLRARFTVQPRLIEQAGPWDFFLGLLGIATDVFELRFG